MFDSFLSGKTARQSSGQPGFNSGTCLINVETELVGSSSLGTGTRAKDLSSPPLSLEDASADSLLESSANIVADPQTEQFSFMILSRLFERAFIKAFSKIWSLS
jgi:hypothetical protein